MENCNAGDIAETEGKYFTKSRRRAKRSTRYCSRGKVTAQYCTQQLLDILREHLVDVQWHKERMCSSTGECCAMKSAQSFVPVHGTFCADRGPSEPPYDQASQGYYCIVVNAGYSIIFITAFIAVVSNIGQMFLAFESIYPGLFPL